MFDTNCVETVTITLPATLKAGVTQERDKEEMKLAFTDAETVPESDEKVMLYGVFASKLYPLIVRDVPPFTGPHEGWTEYDTKGKEDAVGNTARKKSGNRNKQKMFLRRAGLRRFIQRDLGETW